MTTAASIVATSAPPPPAPPRTTRGSVAQAVSSLRLAVVEPFGALTAPFMAPFFGLAARLRRGRALHPKGEIWRSSIRPLADADATARLLADRLSGPALVRLSAALFRNTERLPDVLGVAVRVRPEDPGGDRDLLFATVRHVYTLSLAPFTTRSRDYLANRYFAISPFDIDGYGRAELRLVPRLRTGRAEGFSRSDRLARAAGAGLACFNMEARRPGERAFRAVAMLSLDEPLNLEGTSLRFSVTPRGLGMRPRGFVNALRPSAYRSSQGARP